MVPDPPCPPEPEAVLVNRGEEIGPVAQGAPDLVPEGDHGVVVPDDEKAPEEGGVRVRVAVEVTNSVDEGAPHRKHLPLLQEPLETPVMVPGHHLQGGAGADLLEKGRNLAVLLARGEGDRVLHIPEEEDEVGLPFVDAGEDPVEPPPGLARDVDPVDIEV